MKHFLCTIALILASATLFAPDADAARRMGGGKSMGMQRDNSASTAKPAPQQAAPVQNTAAPSAAPATPSAAPKRNWLGPIAGLAAGLGIAALLSHLGMGAGMANFVMILLLVVAAVVVVRLILRRKQDSSPTNAPANLQYAGAGVGAEQSAPPATAFQPAVAPGVTNPVPGMAAPAATTAASAGTLPADFDASAFVRVAKVQFVRLQAAFDAANLDDIREFTTPEMFAELKLDIDERHGATQRNEVTRVDAEVLEVIAEANRHIASVRFHGEISENGANATAFSEIWHLIKPQQGGWVLAGIQQLN